MADRRANIDAAVAALHDVFGCEIRLSEPYRSAPQGFDSTNEFTNVGASLHTELSPEQVLTAVQRAETMALRQILAKSPTAEGLTHRNADGSYADRLIDIDIIALGHLVIDTPALTVPHPRMHLRDFVLIPMAQLHPRWVHPILNKPLSQLIDELRK